MEILVTTERELGDLVIPFHQTINLVTLVPVSQGEVIGEWTTPSIFLGTTTKGTYYVRDDHMPGYYPERNIPGETKFPAHGVPIAYFQDEKSIPFLTLFNCLPQKLANRGLGRLVLGVTMIRHRFTIGWSKVV